MKACPVCEEKFYYVQDNYMWNRFHCFTCNYDTHPAIRLLNQYRYYKSKGDSPSVAREKAHNDIVVTVK